MIHFASDSRNASFLGYLDWITLGLLLSLISIGWAMIFAVTYNGEADWLSNLVFNIRSLPGKQLVFIGIAMLLLVASQFIDERFWRTFAYLTYGVNLLLLVLVLLIGSEVKGATSWFRFGAFGLQPSEFAKFGTCMAMAAYLSTYSTHLRNHLHQQAITTSIFLLPAGLIMLQPDAGSALVFLSFLLVMYREGMPAFWYSLAFLVTALLIGSLKVGYEWVSFVLLGIAVLALAFQQRQRPAWWRWGSVAALIAGVYGFVKGHALPTLASTALLWVVLLLLQYRYNKGKYIWQILSIVLLGIMLSFATDFAFEKVLKPHQQDRINVWLRPELSDPSGSAYNLQHSKIAIGSGGLLGKGFLNGIMTKGNMVPEQSTDFIFTTIGEEHGFLGSLLLIGLYLALLIRLSILAERQASEFSRVYIYGVTGIIFIHLAVNIGMTIGLVPIIGIPLPFISYGGSSLMGFTLMIGVALRLDSERMRRSL